MPSCQVGRACDRPLADLTGRRSRFSSISHLTSSAQVLKKRGTSVDDYSCIAPIASKESRTALGKKDSEIQGRAESSSGAGAQM